MYCCLHVVRLQRNPGEQELKTVSYIRKRMKEVINVSTFSDDLLSLAKKVAVTLRYVFQHFYCSKNLSMECQLYHYSY